MQDNIRKILLKNIEYNIVEHCNLRCAGCDHSSPLLAKKFVPLKNLEEDLLALKPILRIGTLKLIGGEPTLHPDILLLLKKCKELDIADQIAVITNGTLLHRMSATFWENINVLKVSLYPGIKIKFTLDQLKELCARYKIELVVAYQDIFRHTVIDEKIEDKTLIQKIYNACELPVVHACHTLRNGKLYKCSPAAYLDDRLKNKGRELNNKSDGVDIHNNSNLLKNIINYMSCDKPLISCSYCLGTSGKDFPHHQMRPQEMKNNTQPKILIGDLIDKNKLIPIQRTFFPFDRIQ